MKIHHTLAAALLLASHAFAASAQSSPLAPGAHEAVVNGVRLWYRVAGRASGEPVIFLHGGPGQGSQTFARYAGPALELQQRMVYLDQRGAGRSERPWTKAYSIELMVDDLEALRRQWGVSKMALVGHSFGTVLAMEYAARYPQHVSKLVLSGAVVDAPAALDLQCERLGRIDPKRYAEAVKALPSGSKRRCHIFVAGRAFIDGNMYPDPATMKLVDESDAADGLTNTGEVGAALFSQGFLDYRFAHAAKLTMPVLVVAGGEDHQAMTSPLRSFVSSLPQGRLLEYPGRGHFMFVEDPERFARDVNVFLSQKGRGG